MIQRKPIPQPVQASACAPPKEEEYTVAQNDFFFNLLSVDLCRHTPLLPFFPDYPFFSTFLSFGKLACNKRAV